MSYRSMQGQVQLICSGCRTLLVYPKGASNVRCALCSSVTQVLAKGTEKAQLVCGECQTTLMYMAGATSVQCSCCHVVNIAMEAPAVAHINCGGCGMTLVYGYGSQSVKCVLCQYVTSIAMPTTRAPLPAQQRPPPAHLQGSQPPPALSVSSSQTRTLVVENPMSLNESGKLESNVAVGVATERR